MRLAWNIYIYISYPKRVYNASVLWSKLHYPGPFPLMNVARFYHTPFVKSHFYSTGFSPLSLSLTRTHPSGQFVFISPSNNSPSIPPAAHFHMQPTTNPFERVQSFLDDRSSPTSFLPCFAQGNVSARDLWYASV